MSKKRTSPDSEDSDSVNQQDNNAKRAKLTLLSDTTLQDLPMELIECILIKAVAMEVEDMGLAKSVWKAKADLVISRLRTVCPQWNNILTTDVFRNELHRTLDRTDSSPARHNYIMSKKRTSPESSNDEQTDEGLDSVFQQDDNAKRARLTLCDTELQDLPMELIECILVKAVAMEVEGMKMAKSVWKEKAVLVISRLETVCPQWNYILTTDFFRNELHRTLDRTAQKTIRLEISQQSMLQLHAYKITTLKDEVFIVCISDKYYRYSIHVYDRNNMAEVKDVIPLQGISVDSIAACSVSNCVYLLNRKTCSHISIVRITKDDEHKFNISTLISDLWLLNPYEFVTSNGSIILSGCQRSEPFPVISIYNANGSLQHEIRFSSDIGYFRAIFPKSNGNLILVSQNKQMQARLTEIDRDGSILRQYQSSLCAFGAVCHADIYGRIVIVERPNRFELLDSEFNLLDFTCSQLLKGMVVVPWILHFNSERNEVVTTVENDALTILRFTEE